MNQQQDLTQEDIKRMRMKEIAHTSRVCRVCNFVAKSNRGLKLHLTMSHSLDELDPLQRAWENIIKYW